MPRAQLPEPATGQAEPRRYVDDRFGPDFAVEGLASQCDSLLPHRQILSPVQHVGYAPNPMRMLSWNMAHREAHWHDITNDGDLDIALLQRQFHPRPAAFSRQSPRQTVAGSPLAGTGISALLSLGSPIA
jgi:hypothetical protein